MNIHSASAERRWTYSPISHFTSAEHNSASVVAQKLCLGATKLILCRRLQIPRKKTKKNKHHNIFCPPVTAWGKRTAQSLLLCWTVHRRTMGELQWRQSWEHLTEGDLTHLREVPVLHTLSEEWKIHLTLYNTIKGMLHHVGPIQDTSADERKVTNLSVCCHRWLEAFRDFSCWF